MIRACPECGDDLVELEPDAEFDSRPARRTCPYCEITFERDASGMLFEVDAPRFR